VAGNALRLFTAAPLLITISVPGWTVASAASFTESFADATVVTRLSWVMIRGDPSHERQLVKGHARFLQSLGERISDVRHVVVAPCFLMACTSPALRRF